MLIDAHSHGMHAERDADGILKPPLMSIWRNENSDPQEMIRENNSRGIEKVVLLDPPEITFHLKKVFGDFIIPVPQVDMDRSSAEEVDSLFGRGAKGIKFIAPQYSYGDERYFPLYRAVRENRGLAIFHTGYLMAKFFDPGYILGRSKYIDIANMRPAAVDLVARAFPDMKILMAHFGNPWWEEAWSILSCNQNIYADLSGGTAFQKSMNMWKDLFAPNGKLHNGTVRKLCFASDGTHFVPGESDYVPVLEFYMRLYEELKVPNELIDLINYGNIDMLIKKQ